MYTVSRETEVQLLKRMWRGERVICPRCGRDALVRLHGKAKKSDCDWKCPACGEIYRTIRMLKQLPND